MIVKSDSFTCILISVSHYASFPKVSPPHACAQHAAMGAEGSSRLVWPRLPRVSAPKLGTAHVSASIRLQDSHTTLRDSGFFLCHWGGEKNRNVYQHTAIEQRYGCKNRTRIDLCELFAS